MTARVYRRAMRADTPVISVGNNRCATLATSLRAGALGTNGERIFDALYVKDS